MIPCTDQTILIPYFDGHDVAILQGDTVSVQYYGHAPPCLKEYNYLVTLTKPEVIVIVDYIKCISVTV